MMLNQAGWGDVPVKKYWIISGVFAVVVTLIVLAIGQGKIIVGLTAIISCFGLPKLIMKFKIARRQKAFLEEFADAAAVRLLGGETVAAERVEIHTMAMDGGVMSMRPVEGGLEVSGGGALELKPGGMHLMLIGLKQAFGEGESVPLTLVFDGGVRVETALAVRAMGGGHDH